MQRKTHELEILRLKILLQDLEAAKTQHQEGTAELAVILQEFRERLDPGQVEKYNQYFFGAPPQPKHNTTETSKSTDIVISNCVDLNLDNKKIESKNELPKWARSLYKKIVQRTHPDRYIDFPIEEIKQKFTKIYMTAVEAAEKGELGILLLCAYETEIKYDDIQEALSLISEGIQSSQKKINKIGNLVGYQWYHIDQKDKMIFLENYLKTLGFKFDRKKAEKILRKKPLKRKPGEKPKNFLRVKNKKLK